jgi:hypothetical protein
MAGYMVAELWCDDCLERTQTEDQGTHRSGRKAGVESDRPAAGASSTSASTACRRQHDSQLRTRPVRKPKYRPLAGPTDARTALRRAG